MIKKKKNPKPKPKPTSCHRGNERNFYDSLIRKKYLEDLDQSSVYILITARFKNTNYNLVICLKVDKIIVFKYLNQAPMEIH